jgi:hypothetical protein
MVLLIFRRPDGSGRVARHGYLGRSSIEPTTILLRKRKYRLIGIGLFTCRAIAGALGRRAKWVQMKTSGRGVIVERGPKLGAEPSDTGSGFVV